MSYFLPSADASLSGGAKASPKKSARPSALLPPAICFYGGLAVKTKKHTANIAGAHSHLKNYAQQNLRLSLKIIPTQQSLLKTENSQSCCLAAPATGQDRATAFILELIWYCSVTGVNAGYKKLAEKAVLLVQRRP